MTDVSPAGADPWSVRAMNLPEHARNAIHTDAGAQAAGFRAALVAGVTVYAYLTHVPAALWGRDWLAAGTAEVRFMTPIVDGDAVDCAPQFDDERLVVDAVVDDQARATASFTPAGPDPVAPHRAGTPLQPAEIPLVGEWDGYGERAGDDLALYADAGLVHPAVWPALANNVVQAQLVHGSWIHTRSRIRHHALATVGSMAAVEATVVDRFTTRTGKRAVLDVTITVDGRPVATLEHEAIIEMAP